MLLKVAIGPDVGEDLQPGQARQIAWSGRLVRRLHECAVFTTDSDESAASLIEALKRLGSPEVSLALATLLHQRLEPLPKRNPLPALGNLLDSLSVERWSAVADLILLSQSHVEVMQGNVPDTPELVDLWGILNSDAMERVEQLWRDPIDAQTSREDVWRTRLSPLAQRSESVYVVDRYAATTLYKSLLAGRQRTHSANGVRWFLDHLARSKVRKVMVASSAREIRNDNFRVSEAKDLISAHYGRHDSGISLELALVEGDFAHQRLLAFDGWAGFSFHNGLSSFDEPSFTESISCNASPKLAREVKELFLTLRNRAD